MLYRDFNIFIYQDIKDEKIIVKLLILIFIKQIKYNHILNSFDNVKQTKIIDLMIKFEIKTQNNKFQWLKIEVLIKIYCWIF